MVQESPVASLAFPVLIRPILTNFEKQDPTASHTLKAALSKVVIRTSKVYFHDMNTLRKTMDNF